jgi:uncharacterized protein YcaQ
MLSRPMPIPVSNRAARRFLIERAGLSGAAPKASDRSGLYDAIERLGFVQLDSINAVERAHHHILHSRSRGYSSKHLARLVEKDRLLFEHWTHDAAVLPSAFFPYWRHRFERDKARFPVRYPDRFSGEAFRADCERLLGRVAREGAVLAREFEGDKPKTGWWDWHPSKTALEFLWHTGDLAITRREGFQKVYDLTERVIPAEHFSRRVSEAEFIDWACRSALQRLGFGTRGEIAYFWGLLAPEQVARWLAEHAHELEVLAIEAADGGKPLLAHGFIGAHAEIEAAPAAPPRIRVLNPFDPLVHDRKRAERVFGFHYRIEVFVPEAKRQYGYYVFPVLRGETVVGRLDMRADRDGDQLAVRAFWPEAGVRRSALLTRGIEAELDRIRRFAGLSSVTFEPDWLR